MNRAHYFQGEETIFTESSQWSGYRAYRDNDTETIGEGRTRLDAIDNLRDKEDLAELAREEREREDADPIAARWDHERDHRKHSW